MNGEVFCHWAGKEFEFSKDHVYPIRADKGRTEIKPSGFWFDVEGDWKRWCDAENFRTEYLGVPHEVIVDESRCLRMYSAQELDLFTEKYTMGPMIFKDPLDATKTWNSNDSHMYIDWDKVKKDYAGVIIAPYVWSRRMDYMWYYGWDCASGVVWDLSAVISCKPNMDLKDKFVEIP